MKEENNAENKTSTITVEDVINVINKLHKDQKEIIDITDTAIGGEYGREISKNNAKNKLLNMRKE